MAVMEKLRAGTDSFFIQAVFVIIIVSFVFWGVGNDGPTSAVMATVNGERITDTQFTKVMRRVSSSQTSGMSDEEASALKRQVVDQLIRDRVLLQEARRVGLDISAEQVNRDVFSTPYFRDDNDKFSMEVYERMLKRMGLTRPTYEAEVYERLLRQKLLETVARSARVSPDEVREQYIDENTSVDLRWVALPNEAFMSQVELAQDEVDAVAASRATDIQAAYDQQFERRFKVPRKADISTILLRTDIEGIDKEAVKARLEAVRAEIEGGVPFADAARKWSEDLTAVNGGDLGTQVEQQLDPALAEAVFAAGADSMTQVVETTRGFQLLKVGTVQPEQVTSLEDATPILVREMLQLERAPALAREQAEKLLAEWKASGEPPAESIAASSLTTESESGVVLAQAPSANIPANEAVLGALRDSKEGQVLDEVFTVDGIRVVMQVTSRDDADMENFEEQSATLRQRLTMMEQSQVVRDWQDDLVARADVVRN